MTPSSISTWPMLKLRWKFVESSCASHKQNSMTEKTESSAACARWFVTLSCQISRFSSSGTKYRVLASIPLYFEAIVVYPMPWRQEYSSSLFCVGCHEGDQNSPE